MKIPQLTQEQGQRFFEAFLEDASEPEYDECKNWSATRDFGNSIGVDLDKLAESVFAPKWRSRARRSKELDEAEHAELKRLQPLPCATVVRENGLTCGHVFGVHDPFSGVCGCYGCGCRGFTEEQAS